MTKKGIKREAEDEPEDPIAVLSSPPASARSSGGMSLRPGRRVKVKFEVGGEEVVASGATVEDEDDAMAEAVIDEVLDGDEGLGHVAGAKGEGEGLSLEEVADDEDFFEVSNVIPNRRLSRRKITLGNRRLIRRPGAAGKSVESSTEPPAVALAKSKPYSVAKEMVCTVCARELDLDRLDSFKNLYEDTTTRGGKSLYEVFRAIVREEVHPTFYGSRICSKCARAIDDIEDLYRSYRRAADDFIDTFILGQRVLDADACGMTATAVPEASTEADVAVPAEISSDHDVLSFLDASRCVVKIVDVANNASFNALSIGHDFQVPVEKTYRGSVVASADQLEASDEEAAAPPPNVNGAAEESAEEGYQTDVLTYDTSTGVIEKAPPSASAELLPPQVEVGLPQIYMTADEFEAARKSFRRSTVHLCREDFVGAGWRLLLGRRIREQYVISGAVSEEYERQIPDVERARFTCSDCSASFRHFNMLANHVQLVHNESGEEGAEEGEDGVEGGDHATTRIPSAKGVTLKRQSTVVNELTPKTGEVATMDKPFQCEHCDKCFSEYLTLSAHTDHYHGFSRRCNIEGCDVKVGSIQAFAQHYAAHAEPGFVVPSEFKDKMKTVLPCPQCNISIQGVWKYFQHTFTHDKEARFKCPACGKRIHKVQNYKDHLQRHRQGLIPPRDPGAATAATHNPVAVGSGNVEQIIYACQGQDSGGQKEYELLIV